jgi:Flp pilus assembly pilin Flp
MKDLGIRLTVAAKVLASRASNRQEGATAAEYALLVALIAVFIIGAVTLFGGKISGIFSDSTTKLGGVTTTTVGG